VDYGRRRDIWRGIFEVFCLLARMKVLFGEMAMRGRFAVVGVWFWKLLGDFP